jgi:hypothetical protein
MGINLKWLGLAWRGKARRGQARQGTVYLQRIGEKMKDEELREKIINVGGKALEVLEGYFEGTESDEERVKAAFRVVPQAVKVSHMNQQRVFVERSQAIRLLPYLKDEDAREKYIQLTQPTAKPLLLARPEK